MAKGNGIDFGVWLGRILACLWLVVGATLTPAWAGSFKINPVNIHFPADRQAASLTITNSDAAPVSVRVVAFEWTQANGLDVHTPTSNVIASPPIFTIRPGATQIVRVGLRDRNRTSAYRIVFEEIPHQSPADGQVRVALRLDLPLYVFPKQRGKADLRWRAWRDGAGNLFVEGSNAGSLHAQVLELSAESDGTDNQLSTEMGVVLPNSSRVWKIGNGPDLKVGTPFKLKVRGPAGETQTQIQLDQR